MMVPVPSPNTSYIANPFDLLSEEESDLFTASKIIKHKSDWPLPLVLKSKLIYLSVKPNHYALLFLKLLESNMVCRRETGDIVIENFAFVVFRSPEVFTWLIWQINCSILLF